MFLKILLNILVVFLVISVMLGIYLYKVYNDDRNSYVYMSKTYFIKTELKKVWQAARDIPTIVKEAKRGFRYLLR